MTCVPAGWSGALFSYPEKTNMPLHPIVAAVIEKNAGLPAFSDGSAHEARARLAEGRQALGPGPAMHSVEEISIPVRHGTIRARVYRPHEDPSGVVVYLHGGGWVLGEIEDFDTYARALAAASGCVVILPAYRLAPEHPFPAALEDVEDALIWADGARGLLVREDVSLVIAGDSAGANLATVAAARLRGRVELAAQVLYYPVTDNDFTRESYRKHGSGLPLLDRDMKWFFEQYAPAEVWSDPAVAPIRSPDLAGLPPAIVVCAEYDVLLDEGLAYAEKLRANGVEVNVRVVEGLPHGFVRLHNIVDSADMELKVIGSEILESCTAR